jgi:nicotinate phosphoribosyltransferase
MSQIQLTPEEYSWLKANIPFFKPWYLEYLRNYRYNPAEVKVWLDEEKDLVIEISGTWASTILWEVPLMATISELYFREVDTQWDEQGVLTKAIDKGKRLADAGCLFSEFGTRRRRSVKIHETVLTGLNQGAKKMLVGTSNLMMAMKYGLKVIGTQAHEWIMGMSVLEGLYNANYFSLQNWVRVYHADLGIALTDTYGLPSFIRNFNLEFAKLYDGTRHDSGCPYNYTGEIIRMYEKFKIPSISKSIVYSDGLDVDSTIDIHRFAGKNVRDGYGMGTHFTNDFENSPALNMVIKLWSCGRNEAEGQLPVVKLSDSPGKVMGDADAVKVAKWMHQGKELCS